MHAEPHSTSIDEDLLRKYTTRAPRYTSYPTAPQWTDALGPDDFAAHLGALPDTARDLSLYVHMPFCKERCTFCGCNVVISKRPEIANDYLSWLEREADLMRAAMPDGDARQIRQLHWGGGTPNYLTGEQMRRLFKIVSDRFDIADDAEIALELDPRRLTDDQVEALDELGFNRASMGIQDTDARVQEAVNRVQPHDVVQGALDRLRGIGIDAINIDLIYGLPFQTIETWQRTLEDMRAFAPDRVAMYGFAYLPDKMKQQKHMTAEDLPTPEERFDLLVAGLRWFTDNGYLHLGMDHFAKETDELAVAWQNKTMRRNFMGYTTQAGTDLLALGSSSISFVQNVFFQNHKHLPNYKHAVLDGKLPVDRGLRLDRDDQIRADVIHDLMCFNQIDRSAISERFDIDFGAYFADELERLKPLVDDALVTIDDAWIRTTPRGLLLLRNVASVFDAYLHARRPDAAPVYSKTV